MTNKMICVRCNQPDVELKIIGCGCCLHVTCFPTSIFDEFRHAYVRKTEPPDSLAERVCPHCQKAINGIYLFPINLDEIRSQIDRNEIIKSQCKKKRENVEMSDKMNEFYVTIAPSLLLSCSTESSECEEVDFRNGRWTKEELSLIQYLIMQFEMGNLAIPHGVKLNDFLRGTLLCKSTRLRKKMKFANFCTKNYNLTPRGQQNESLDTNTLLDYQHSFLNSLETDTERRVIKFNISRMWVTHFLNFCLQIKYKSLNSEDWLSGLEYIERQVSKAKEQMKQKQRRRRIDIASTSTQFYPQVAQDLKSTLLSSIAAGCTKETLEESSKSKCRRVLNSKQNITDCSQECVKNSNTYMNVSNSKDENASLNYSALEENSKLLNVQPYQLVNDSELEEKIKVQHPIHYYNQACVDLKRSTTKNLYPLELEKLKDGKLCERFGDWRPFFTKVSALLEKEKLPFEYADVWVESDEDPPNDESNNTLTPSYISKTTKQLRLCHVGHTTRCDTDSIFSLYHMNEFGRYSSQFSFPPGVGKNLLSRYIYFSVPLTRNAEGLSLV